MLEIPRGFLRIGSKVRNEADTQKIPRDHTDRCPNHAGRVWIKVLEVLHGVLVGQSQLVDFCILLERGMFDMSNLLTRVTLSAPQWSPCEQWQDTEGKYERYI